MTEYKSAEEQEFAWWCEEALEHKIISDYVYEPCSFELSGRNRTHFMKHLKTKVKETEKIIRPHIYTPDFKIAPGINFELVETRLCQSLGRQIFIDTKGSYNRYGGDREFSINQKWMLQKYDIYVNKVVLEKFFKLSWVPEKARYTPKKHDLKKCYIGFKNIGDIIFKKRLRG